MKPATGTLAKHEPPSSCNTAYPQARFGRGPSLDEACIIVLASMIMVCELPQQRAYTHIRDHVGCSGPPLPAQQHALLVTHVHRISHPRRFFFLCFFFRSQSYECTPVFVNTTTYGGIVSGVYDTTIQCTVLLFE